MEHGRRNVLRSPLHWTLSVAILGFAALAGLGFVHISRSPAGIAICRKEHWAVAETFNAEACARAAASRAELEEQRRSAEFDKRMDEEGRKAAELNKQMIEALPDPGSIRVTSQPPQAGAWLKLGRTPFDSIPLDSEVIHELRVELDGYHSLDTQVVAHHWTGNETTCKAAIAVALTPVTRDATTGNATSAELPPMPAAPPGATGITRGRGPIHVESTPEGADVWMYIGMTDGAELSGVQAGLGYELRALSKGFLPGRAVVAPDDWRVDRNGAEPIKVARKKAVVDVAITLARDPSSKAP